MLKKHVPCVVATLMTCVLLLCSLSRANAADKPNVVFFLVDDLGWTDLGCYGSKFYETPNIDTFAKDAVRFTQAYAACHVCSPTRASIMTGKYPARLGLTDWLSGRRNFDFQRLKTVPTIQQLPFEETTIAEALKGEGYQCAHIGKWHLGEEPSGPLQHGFDLQIPNWNKGWPKAGYHAPFKLDGINDKEGEYLTDRLTDSAVKFIRENAESPFFLYLSHFAVHDPIQGRRDLVEKYKRKLENSVAMKATPFVLEGNPDDESPLRQEQLDQLIDAEPYKDYKVLPNRTVKIKQHQDNPEFAGMVESMDESFGRILVTLEQLGLSENTIVIFFSDNGGMSAANFGNPKRIVNDDRLDAAYSTSNLPLRGAKGWLYEGGIREPMLVRCPGGKSGIDCDVPVISTDFYPTIMELVGVENEDSDAKDGESLVPLLHGKRSLDRDAIFWHFPHYSNHGMQSPGGAIRMGDWKLLEYFENGSVQLFNLSNDIGEKNDLAKTEPTIATKLKNRLAEWRKSVGAKMMLPNPNFSQHAENELGRH